MFGIVLVMENCYLGGVFLLFDIGVCCWMCFCYLKNDAILYVTAIGHALFILLGAFYAHDFALKACSLSQFVLMILFLKAYHMASEKNREQPF